MCGSITSFIKKKTKMKFNRFVDITQEKTLFPISAY